jgi:hypothetical protein
LAEPPGEYVERDRASPPLAGWFGCVLSISALALGVLIWFGSLARPFDRDGPTPKVLADLRVIENALAEYAARNAGQFPRDLSELVTPDEHGYRYLQSTTIPRDAWKHPYAYRPPSGSKPKPVVFSVGKDGLVGTEDDLQLESVVE